MTGRQFVNDHWKRTSMTLNWKIKKWIFEKERERERVCVYVCVKGKKLVPSVDEMKNKLCFRSSVLISQESHDLSQRKNQVSQHFSLQLKHLSVCWFFRILIPLNFHLKFHLFLTFVEKDIFWQFLRTYCAICQYYYNAMKTCVIFYGSSEIG